MDQELQLVVKAESSNDDDFAQIQLVPRGKAACRTGLFVVVALVISVGAISVGAFLTGGSGATSVKEIQESSRVFNRLTASSLPGTNPSAENGTAEPLVDVFVRSYRGDLRWLPFLFSSLTLSMRRQPNVINKVIFSVPAEDWALFDSTLKSYFVAGTSPSSDRFIVVPSQIRISSPNAWFRNSGYEEQMLDKLHADIYSNASFIMYLDTDTILVSDLTIDQLFDSQGRPHLSWRYAAESGMGWSKWMQGATSYMFGFPPEDGNCWGRDFMVTLGYAYPRWLLPHLRKEVVLHNGGNGSAWATWVFQARNGGAGWRGPIPFTEFNAMGYILCRDFYDSVNWIHQSNYTEMARLALPYQPLQSITMTHNPSILNAEHQKMICLIQRQNETYAAINLERPKFCR